MAQKAGSFVAGLEIGITSAVGDFRNDTLEANTGFGLGAEVRYFLLNGLSFGPFIRYNRFGSSIQSSEGNISYNFAQYGGVARLNIFDVNNGRFYLVGGGGLFTPKGHVWAPDYTSEEEFETGQFVTGGIGLSSDTGADTIYELELKSNRGNADYKRLVLNQTQTTNYKFDFIYIAVKLSFNSKGVHPPPRY